jgi:Holliday junction resolvase
MYWMVASIDPLIVLYTDGFARVGNADYDETDFSDTKKHLTTMTFLDTEMKGTMDEVKVLLNEHYQNNVAELSKRFKGDPYQHVRNQMKEAIAETVAAFKEKTFGNDKTEILTAENGFALYGADFVLDNNLEIWYLESQSGPAMIEDYDFKITLHRQLLQTTFNVMQEIQDKIEANPHANVLPLDSNIEGWDIVYAGDWMYQYDDLPETAHQTGVAHLPNRSQILL